MQSWVIGNWKQNPATNNDVNRLLDQLLTAVSQDSATTSAMILPCQLMVAPSCVHLASVSARTQGTPILCAAQDISAHSESTGAYTGNNAKMSVTFSQTGSSTNCTMRLYGSDHEDLSLPGIIATCNLGSGEDPVRVAIDPIAIPAYSFGEIVNDDPVNSAIGTIEITTWQEPAE